jgi:hypothetical protein
MKITNRNFLENKIYLFDTEEQILSKEFVLSLSNNEDAKFSMKTVTLNEVNELEKKIDDSSLFEQIVIASSLKVSKLLGIYKNEDGLRTYYDFVNSKTESRPYLVIFSFGEEQPTKYALQVESVWQVDR